MHYKKPKVSDSRKCNLQKRPSLLRAKLGLLANFRFQGWELQTLGKKCTPVNVDLVTNRAPTLELHTKVNFIKIRQK